MIYRLDFLQIIIDKTYTNTMSLKQQSYNY